MKWKALIVSPVLLILAISFFGQDLFWVFGSLAVMFFSYAAYKFIGEFLSAQVRSVPTSKTPHIQMTSKGSRRLFVPPPIDN